MPPPLTVDTPAALRLTSVPVADCQRYDRLRRPNHGKLTGAGRVTPKACLRHDEPAELYGFKVADNEITTTALKRQHEPQQIVGDLLNTEISEKQTCSAASTSTPRSM